MKYHKIRNVDIHVCTAEQKIAYNLAVREYQQYILAYDRASRMGQLNIISDAIHSMIDSYCNSYDYNPNKYDIDAIFCALYAGFESYLTAPYHILSSYEEIGKMFPAEYLR